LFIPLDVNISSVDVSNNSSGLGWAEVSFSLEIFRVITETTFVSSRDLDVVVFLSVQASDVIKTLVSRAVNSKFISRVSTG
jgi:hypothetical protein